MFVIHLKLFEASFLVLGHTILFGLPLFPYRYLGKQDKCLRFPYLHCVFLLLCASLTNCTSVVLRTNPSGRAPITQSLQFSTQCLWKGAWRGAGGRGIGPILLVLGFLLFHLHIVACALLLALVLVFFSVFVHLCGAFVQLEVPARLVTNPAPDRQNRQL